MQFASKTRFIHRECKYLHVDVDFELVKPANIQPSPEDRIIKVSKLYLEYSIND